jgi:hypothetical protein
LQDTEKVALFPSATADVLAGAPAPDIKPTAVGDIIYNKITLMIFTKSIKISEMKSISLF